MAGAIVEFQGVTKRALRSFGLLSGVHPTNLDRPHRPSSVIGVIAISRR